MASGLLSPIGMIVQLLSDTGVVGNGFQIYTYVAGTVNTPVTTYTASNLFTPNSNPIVMGANGRFQGVSVWAPPGTVIKMVITDASNNPISGGTIDNIPLINDTTSILTSLANPAFGSGVDLVANAVKSFGLVANVQAVASPTLAAGQTLIISVEGKASIGDGLAGLYYWAPLSAAPDDNGATTISPAGAPAQGRFLRLNLPYPGAFGVQPPAPGGVFTIGLPVYIVKPTDQQVASSTVLVNDTALTIGLPIGTYLISPKLNLLGIGGTTQGYKVQLTFSGTSVASGAGAWNVSVNGSFTGGQLLTALNTPVSGNAIGTSNVDVAEADQVVIVQGQGTLTVQFAQFSSSANATVMKTGSLLAITRLA